MSSSAEKAAAAKKVQDDYEALLKKSRAYLDDFLKEHGWTYDDTPTEEELQPLLRDLASIYEDGKSEDGKISIWKLQLGTKNAVRAVMEERANAWDDQKLNDVREKDALWAWVYSRYFYRAGAVYWCDSILVCCRYSECATRRKALVEADLKETAKMQLMVQSLRGDGAAFDVLFNSYQTFNRQKYWLLIRDPAGAARIVDAMSDYI